VVCDLLHKWCVTLKSLKGTDEYAAFRMLLNGKAKERGTIREYGREQASKKRRVEQIVDEAPVVYDCDEFMASVEI
jgi:hypothetical protein